MVLYESDIKESAISAMQNCMAYISAGNMRKAHIYFGQASVYDELLLDAGIDLEEENEHYKEMKDIYWEKGETK